MRATRTLRDWLLTVRSDDIDWRNAWLPPDPDRPELNAQIAALHEFDVGTPQHLLGDLLGYWFREWRADVVPKMAQLQADPEDALDAKDIIAGLRPTAMVEKIRGQREPRYGFEFDPQVVDGFPLTGGSVMYLTPEGTRMYAGIDRLDRDAGELDLVWNADAREADHFPAMVVFHEYFNDKVKSEALSAFAESVLDDGRTPNRVTMALLCRDIPRFTRRRRPHWRSVRRRPRRSPALGEPARP